MSSQQRPNKRVCHPPKRCYTTCGIAHVFPSDKLRDPGSLHPGSAIIANTNLTAAPPGHIGHWIAILALNDRSRPPEYVDGYGVLPDDRTVFTPKTH